MALELSDVTFTEQNDNIFGNPILNTYIANTLSGDDRINAANTVDYNVFSYAFKNMGVLNTGDGNDVVACYTSDHFTYPIFNCGFVNEGTLNAGEGNDYIQGSGYQVYRSWGYFNGIHNKGTLNTGEGDDTISGDAGENGEYGFLNEGTLNTEDGNDIIIASISLIDTGNSLALSIRYGGTFNTGNGDDFISTTGIFLNSGGVFLGNGNDRVIVTGRYPYDGPDYRSLENYNVIEAGDGDDFILTTGGFLNSGGVFLGNGNDRVIANGHYTYDDPDYRSLENYNAIETGDGDDSIISNNIIYNEGIINTGDGDDTLLGNGYGIYNKGGSINTGDGNDSIISNYGFESGPNSSGAWFLGEGEDYIKGFGSGDFYGGNGNDTLELTPGTYTVGIWDRVTFSKGNSLMLASEFEQLKAGSTIYDFSSLTAGQIITVA